jgi:hypothetical protein
LKTRILWWALAAAAALPAQAQTFSGNTTGAPRWNRPFESLTGVSPNGLLVRYQVIPFTVTLAGSYNFVDTSLAPAAWDNFTFIYAGSFDPAAPLVNGLIGNDDYGSIGVSGFAVALESATPYFFVTTGFNAPEFGSYRLDVTGPGQMVAALVPEPASYGLMGLGLAALLLAARRRQGV